MQVRQVLLCRVIQLARASTNIGWVPDLISEIGAKYEFTIVPQSTDLFGKEKKAEFKHGRLATNVIDSFTLYADGFVIDTSTSTDNAEFFLNDFMQWLKAKVPELQEVGKRFFLSHLEVKLDIGKFGDVLGSIGQKISGLLQGYDLPGMRPLAFSQLQLAQDPIGKTGLLLSVFSIERRLNVPYADNIFFAQAPLKTADHEAMLQELEKIFLS